MTVRLNGQSTPVYRCRVKGHCQTPAERVDAHVEEVIVDRLSRDDVSDLVPATPQVDVAGLRDELRVLDERKVEAAQRFAAGSIDGTQLDTITAAVDGRRAEIRAQLAEAPQNSPLAEFAATTNATELWDSLTLGRKREIVKLLPLSVTLLPIGRGRSFTREHIRIPAIDDGNGDGIGGTAANAAIGVDAEGGQGARAVPRSAAARCRLPSWPMRQSRVAPVHPCSAWSRRRDAPHQGCPAGRRCRLRCWRPDPAGHGRCPWSRAVGSPSCVVSAAR